MMSELSDKKSELQAPFSTKDLEWRIQQSGKSGEKVWALVLCYVTNRAIMSRLDDVFGIDGWRNEYKEWHGNGQLCGISVWDKVNQHWITKWDGADNTNIEATKGGLSDSMKRAAVQWGIGRYLYNLDSTFATVISNKTKTSYSSKVKIDGKDTWINWESPILPDWATLKEEIVISKVPVKAPVKKVEQKEAVATETDKKIQAELGKAIKRLAGIDKLFKDMSAEEKQKFANTCELFGVKKLSDCIGEKLMFTLQDVQTAILNKDKK